MVKASTCAAKGVVRNGKCRDPAITINPHGTLNMFSHETRVPTLLTEAKPFSSSDSTQRGLPGMSAAWQKKGEA